MAASVFDSALFSGLFPTGEAGRLFSDSAELRAMLLVEGMLARAQGDLGVIPADSAAAISRAAMEVQIDPGALSTPTGKNGVSVPGLVTAFRAEMQAPEHAQYVHWGATSQDIIDTGLMLRLRQALAQIETSLLTTLSRFAELAADHAALPMPGRTYGQHATPTSFGSVVASWGRPVLALVQELPDLRDRYLLVSLSGAAGTSAALGSEALETRRKLAELLSLTDPSQSWHTDRTPILKIADWCTRVTLALGKLAQDITDLTQTGIGELRLGDAGASSTMPQKQNPVGPAALLAIANQTTGLNATLQGAAIHRHQRDGAAWFTEWMVLPQIVLGAASAATIADQTAGALHPVPMAMAAALDGAQGTIHAEALSFALCEFLPRPEAQKTVKALCKEASESQSSLKSVVQRDWPDLDCDAVFDPAQQMGFAPQEARAFAQTVSELLQANAKTDHAAP